jgi:23S rRNA (uracil1939-C5)-methyltransferase
MSAGRGAQRKRRSPRRARRSGYVRDIARGGEAVVATDQGVVLAPLAVPGEEVEVDRIERRGGVERGRLARVRAPSHHRVEAPCERAEACGGCPLMTLSIGEQRRFKAGWVAEAVGWTEVPMRAPSPDLAYRRRARLAFQATSAGARLGYRGHRSRHVVDVPTCPVLAPVLDDALERVRRELAPHLVGRGELRLTVGTGGRPVVSLSSAEPQPPALYSAARELVGAFAGVALYLGGATTPAVFGDPAEELEGPGGDLLRGPAGAFSQANDAVNEALVETVVQLAEPAGRTVVELYAGMGNLTVPLARRAARVVAVERDPAAARAAEENLRRAGLTAEVRAGEAEAEPLPKADVLVLDPPRTGARDALGRALGTGAERIVYVSCDPVTLGRDVATLRDAGYEVDHAMAFDMFPHTAHVEAVVRLRRRSR